ncbi:Gfo/Idh/MocA family oxidoreductase [Arenibacter sp. 6A1]|uniref:Gfo/Idh/MocA family protein n=1 Tax=Arenibacter sp. 6A1 TaxID=2720391 RepID=UPI0014475719|nr:Gfo/Idh/MocA family oxidoreductase [Arenibacter sp. 6A1]NKI25445.1 Gfo/Idh/MocA family oxidoreductase [Arenibacter sp. 6A1]
MSTSESNFNRRKFLRSSALVGAFMGLPGVATYSRANATETVEKISAPRPVLGKSVIGLKVAPIEKVKVAFIGVGMRGASHVKQIAALDPKAEVVAICDIRDAVAQKSVDFLKSKGNKKVKKYSGSKDAWKEMLRQDNIDLVIISTPWEDHVPMSVYAMQQGKHVALEVPAAYTVEDCWKLVDTAEETQRNCMMLENVCYGNEELTILQMVEQGVFGTLTHGEAAYIHDLKDLMFSQNAYYQQWRLKHNEKYDGNLYPTHGLGPVAQYMGVGRGDRFGHLVSMSSLEASLSEYAKTVESDNEFFNRNKFAHGDMNTTLIQTAKGRSIMLQHDVVSPRPYSRINALSGTKAYHEGYPSRLSIAGKGHDWLKEAEYKAYMDKYKHPIWDHLKEEIKLHGGHGGMDFIMLYRLIDCFNNGKALDQDVYDAADWSVVTPLSGISIELGNIPVKFPDFTRGKWQEERRLGIMEDL